MRDRLAGSITSEEFQEISETLASIKSLDPELVDEVKYAFAQGYNKQFQLLTGFSGAAFLTSLLLIGRHPITVKGTAEKNASRNTSEHNQPVQSESRIATETVTASTTRVE